MNAQCTCGGTIAAKTLTLFAQWLFEHAQHGAVVTDKFLQGGNHDT
ncbi:Uncharacterised protein [Mycobacteroides abscessus subsp. bolletii]|nr:Uncharacterised protein [Mycobacteroides abscessus subsp. bolletii]SKS27942.1 Uncharacterised protein [Mycobacteroides abscessus subsp. abscessus]SHW63694.1 Uncharacterised protein [Mycobacteroides abscessus subsp. bolletii]SHW91737.1 Uncharacterised protein [Mycobacteroides abscessus subsp. bolletii]SHX33284.1 Uncharacterised protein [Mycobacteroides abscessus subsp. bolletii]